MVFGIKSFLFENITRHEESEQNETSNNDTTFFNDTIFFLGDTINNTEIEDSIDIKSEIMKNFENLCFQNIPDFNVLFITSAFGNIFLKFCGYRISTFIFVCINALIVFFYSSMDFPEERYSNFYSLILIIIYYILLLFSVGSCF